MSPEFTRELETLRRRAYGLDADIDSDPVALRRLSELEAALHPTATHAEVTPTEVTPTEKNVVVRPLTLVAADVPDEMSDPVRHTPVFRRSRRAPSLRVVSAIVAATVALAWVASHPFASTGDVVLAPTKASAQERQDLIDEVDLFSFGMTGARLQSFAPFRQLSVWSAVNTAGMTCLLVRSQSDGVFHVGCTPSPLQPSLDLRVGYDVRPELVDDLAPGSVVRLVLHGDDVGVWVAEAPDPRS